VDDQLLELGADRSRWNGVSSIAPLQFAASNAKQRQRILAGYGTPYGRGFNITIFATENVTDWLDASTRNFRRARSD